MPSAHRQAKAARRGASPSMVLAVAALLFQLHASQPVSMTNRTTAALDSPTAESSGIYDGTKPKTAKADATQESATTNAEETKAPDKARTDLDLQNLPLTGGETADENAKTSATFTDISLTNLQKQGISTVRVPDDSTIRPVPVPAVKSYPSRRDWIVLAAFEHGAAAFDAYTTRQAIGRGAVEEDPMMRPFAHSPAIYAAIQVGPLVADLLARKMQRSENPVFRKIWWMPQTLSGVSFLTSGIHNTRVQGRP